MTLELRFDGGCKPTNPGPRYGSYAIFKNGRELAREEQFELGHGTNNEAEWLSMIVGLDRLICGALKKGWPLKEIEVSIVTDSMTVASRVNRPHGPRPKPGPQCRMWVMASHAFGRLHQLGAFKASWRPRDGNVSDFGH